MLAKPDYKSKFFTAIFAMLNKEDNLNRENEEIERKIKDDLPHLYDYPSIGKLFSTNDSKKLQQLRGKLNSTRERLDLIIRRGSKEEAKKATKALEALTITLNFLQGLEDELTGNSQ